VSQASIFDVTSTDGQAAALLPWEVHVERQVVYTYEPRTAANEEPKQWGECFTTEQENAKKALAEKENQKSKKGKKDASQESAVAEESKVKKLRRKLSKKSKKGKAVQGTGEASSSESGSGSSSEAAAGTADGEKEETGDGSVLTAEVRGLPQDVGTDLSLSSHAGL
jgi:hypothetical protein